MGWGRLGKWDGVGWIGEVGWVGGLGWVYGRIDRVGKWCGLDRWGKHRLLVVSL